MRSSLVALCLASLAAVEPVAVPQPDPTPQPGMRERPAGSLTGQLLVATPDMPDPRFARTVIYMVRHDGTGAMGLIVNRPLGDAPLAQVLERLGIESQGASGKIRVHYGGPVQGGRGFVLHTPDWSAEGTLAVNNEAAVTTNPEVLRAIAASKGPRRSLFAFGYAGWAPGQLEAELEQGSWTTAPADEALLFDDDYAAKWQRARDRQVIRL